MQKILKGFFLFALLLATPAYAQTAFEHPLRVIIYGDTLTSGFGLRPHESFGEKLKRRLQTDGFEVEVINMSKENHTLAEANKNLDFVIGKAPDLVVLQLGEEDVKRGIPADLIRKHMYDIAFTLREKGIYVVVMGTRPPASMGQQYIDHVAYTFNEIGKVSPLYPYVLQGISGKQEMTLADGYHPNARGVDLMVNGVYQWVDAGLRWRMQVIAELRKDQPTNQTVDFDLPPALPH